LAGIDHGHGQGRSGQRDHERTLIAAGRFEHDQGGVERVEPCNQVGDSRCVVDHTPRFGVRAEGNVQMGFGDINTDVQRWRDSGHVRAPSGDPTLRNAGFVMPQQRCGLIRRGARRSKLFHGLKDPGGDDLPRKHGEYATTQRYKGLIELAYRQAEAAGIPVSCQDEAGPYQTVPYPGASWQPEGEPLRQPHEYLRHGTAKLLTLFRPATGEVRATGVTSARNAVLHPWLQAELTPILAALPVVPEGETESSRMAQWATWLGHELRDPLPPLRLILVWDNLAGHLSWAIVRWLLQHGVMPLYTPISGSWLNLP